MKKIVICMLAFLFLSVSFASAHHPAADIVDDEIYAMIDSMVADTPHADLDFDDMDGDILMTISTRAVEDIEAMIGDGLMTYVSSLSGRVSVEITFRGGGRTIFTVTQLK